MILIDIGEDNWPSFLPVVHSDIANDIPVHLQRLQYIALMSYIGVVVATAWNMIAMYISVCSKGVPTKGPIVIFGSYFFIVTGVPLAYVMWYRPLYRACMGFTDNAVNFEWFFWYLFHIAVFFVAAVAPPSVTGTFVAGLLPALDLVRSKHMLVGIVYFIAFGVNILEALLSVWVLKLVYVYFRGGGKEAHMECEAIREALRAQV